MITAIPSFHANGYIVPKDNGAVAGDTYLVGDKIVFHLGDRYFSADLQAVLHDARTAVRTVDEPSRETKDLKRQIVKLKGEIRSLRNQMAKLKQASREILQRNVERTNEVPHVRVSFAEAPVYWRCACGVINDAHAAECDYCGAEAG